MRRLVGAVVFIALLGLAAIPAAIWLTLPGSADRLVLSGLSAAAEVSFDADGIPRIRAASAVDAAAALGAVHARDRLFQMELMRRAASGRLSEIAGTATLRLDRLTRTLGLRQRALAELPLLPPETRALLDAYASGVNAYIRSHGRFTAPEFVVLGAPEPWTAADSLLWGETMSLYLSGNWRTELARAALQGRLPPDRVREMWPPQDATPGPAASLIAPIPDVASRLTSLLPRFPDPFTLPQTASNEWAVDGRHSATGAPLLAGDPHLAYGLPGIWYLARIETPAGVLVGATSPGVPFLVIGHNGRIAWTFTTNGADTQDVFIETGLPDGRYETPDGPRAFTVREEHIGIRGQPDEVLRVRETRHGPVISDLDAPTGPVLAVAVASLAPGDTAAAGLMMLDQAADVDAAGRAAAVITAPVQNLLVADGTRIAQFTTGRVPLRRAGDGSVPVPGADGAHDWVGFASGDALPHVVAPASGRLVNGNERVAPPDFPVFMGTDWFGDWRARRIRTLLAATDQHTPASFAAMQVDVVSEFARQLLPTLLAVSGLDGAAGQAQALLRDWDGSMGTDLPQPLIFTAWMRRFEAAVLARAGVPALGPWADFVAFVLSPPGQGWCGGDCAPLLVQSLRDATAELAGRFGGDPSAWRWGIAHDAVFGHPLLQGLGAARIEQPGDDTTIFRGGSRGGTGPARFDSVHGPGFRGVYDMAGLDRSLFIAAPGQSGNPFRPLSRAMVERWRNGATVRIGPTPDTVTATMRLSP